MSDYPLHSQNVNGRQMVVVPSEIKQPERGVQQALVVLSREEKARRRAASQPAQTMPAPPPQVVQPPFAILSRAEVVRRRYEREKAAMAQPAAETRPVEIVENHPAPIEKSQKRRGRAPKKR